MKRKEEEEEEEEDGRVVCGSMRVRIATRCKLKPIKMKATVASGGGGGGGGGRGKFCKVSTCWIHPSVKALIHGEDRDNRKRGGGGGGEEEEEEEGIIEMDLSDAAS